MRHNRTAEAAALLQDVVDWCARTGTPETSIGHFLFLHPGFVGLMRLRLQVTEEKEAAVRQFMADHPNGYHGELPITHGIGARQRPPRAANVTHVAARLLSDDEIKARQVYRDPCPRCGSRADSGCGHRRPGDPR